MNFTMVTRSSTKTEYIEFASTIAKILWPNKLLRDVNIPILSPIYLWCDNIALANNLVFYPKQYTLSLTVTLYVNSLP